MMVYCTVKLEFEQDFGDFGNEKGVMHMSYWRYFFIFWLSLSGVNVPLEAPSRRSESTYSVLAV